MNHQSHIKSNHFEVLKANDDSRLMDQCQHLRYQVYCVERGFLDPGDYPNDRESDAFDAQALHFLSRHCDNRSPAGTARIVPCTEHGLPMLQHCEFSPEHSGLLDTYAGNRYAEVSRLAVSKSVRQRADDTPYGGLPRADRRPAADSAAHAEAVPAWPAWPEIVAGLYKAVYQEAKRMELSGLLVAMERSLAVLLKRMHLVFEPVGPQVDYYGPVRPFVMDFALAEQRWITQSPETAAYLFDGLEEQYLPRGFRDGWQPRPEHGISMRDRQGRGPTHLRRARVSGWATSHVDGIKRRLAFGKDAA
jgi:N-acyl amino acid synthase of PEP-CTERM/exosortase system